MLTKEGQLAYIEAIEFLREQKPLRPLKWSEHLKAAAQDHVDDVGPKGAVSSIGTEGSMPTDRISKYAQLDTVWAESNIFGGLDAAEVMERLIVCDGQPSRGFRKAVFNHDLNLCGIASGPHLTHGNMI